MEIKDIVNSIINSKNRAVFIKEFLNKNNITFKEIIYNFGNNIEVTIKGEQSEEIIFLSHYDIANGTNEGANDNTSSVAVLLCLLLCLKDKKPLYNLKIVFNDKEEVVGGLISNVLNNEKLTNIIERIGSFDYLKYHCNKNKNLRIFILELSGIGDSIYISKNSGNISCDKELIDFTVNIANQNNFKNIIIDVPYTDMVSVHTLGYKGVVIGAIPYNEALLYSQDKKNYPSIWKNIHSNKDNIFTIQEKSLNLMLNFVITLIENLKLLKKN